MMATSSGYRAATVGTFDGVHRGHRAVLALLRREAAERGLQPVAVTFDSHPLSVIAPGRAPGELYTPDEKRHMLEAEGVRVLMMSFTPQMMRMTAAEWLTMLRDSYAVRLIVLGYDNTFGSDGRHMTHTDYMALGRSLGIETVAAPEVAGCSSSRIRRALADGDVGLAGGILGRPYTLQGTVVSGDRIGRTIGFPTANLDTSAAASLQLPAYGVYLTRVRLDDGRIFAGITNIGVRPSVTDTPCLRIETHLLDFSGDLYGRHISVSFLRRIRDEKRFGSLALLKDAIAADEAAARALWPMHDDRPQTQYHTIHNESNQL